MKDDGFITPEVDDFDIRAAAWVATLPEGKRAQWTEIFALGRDILAKTDSIRRSLAECNVILARTNGKMVAFFNQPDAPRLDDAR